MVEVEVVLDGSYGTYEKQMQNLRLIVRRRPIRAGGPMHPAVYGETPLLRDDVPSQTYQDLVRLLAENFNVCARNLGEAASRP